VELLCGNVERIVHHGRDIFLHGSYLMAQSVDRLDISAPCGCDFRGRVVQLVGRLPPSPRLRGRDVLERCLLLLKPLWSGMTASILWVHDFQIGVHSS